MTLSLRAAVIAVPLLTFGCASFAEEPAPPKDEPQQVEAIPKSGTPADQKVPTFNQTTCSAGDTWSELTLGVNEKGKVTRVVMKFGGRNGTADYKGELITEVLKFDQLGEAEVRLEVAQTMVPVMYDWRLGGNSVRPPDMLDVRGITMGRIGDVGVVRLETVGQGFTTACASQEAVEVGGVARKLIALRQR